MAHTSVWRYNLYIALHMQGPNLGQSCCRMQMQGLSVNKCLYTYPQLLSLPMSVPGKGHRYKCDHYRLSPCGGPVDHSASHWDEIAHACPHKVSGLHEELCTVDACTTPTCRHRHALCTAHNLTRTLHLLPLWSYPFPICLLTGLLGLGHQQCHQSFLGC